MTEELAVIEGSGGGKKQPKAHTPVEAPNTLQSNMRGRILDLIQYGPIRGLVNGWKSVYLDDTPVENADGTRNFDGLTLTTREGYPDQEMIPGFRAVENSREINTAVLFDNPPVRAVTNNDADAVLVTVQLSGLASQADNGDLNGYNITVMIDLSSNGGAWQTVVTSPIDGKTTSPFPETFRVDLPRSGGPFSIRVRRGNPESTSQKISDALTWTVLTEVIDARLSYPNMALVGIEVDARLFGNSLPSRSYDMYLSIVKVPTNYDPETRQYTGIWDGQFKEAWTDNPAWAFYDLATHPVIGAGLKDVDKWELYQIARYCDELVPDGYGGMEPRFTINTVFAEQDDAVQALNALASCFRGMAYWGSNAMVPVGDMPRTPVKIVSPANVVDGDLEYVGTSEIERHSVAVVMWNDPNDFGKLVPEVYEDARSIQEFGWREVRVTAVGCNSRGQALRLAKWILYSEREETDTLTYRAVADQADLMPGDIIEVADPYHQGARMGGRVVTTGTNTLVLDQVPADAVQQITTAWFVSVLLPDGSVHRSEVSSFSGNTVNLLTPCPQEPVPGAMWALSALGLVLPQYRVVSVREETDSGHYLVTATQYDPRKYDIVELDLVLPELPTSLLPSGPLGAPLSLAAETYKYFAGNSDHQGLLISWQPSKDARVTTYVLDVRGPTDGGFRTVYTGLGVSFDLKDIQAGQWTIRVRAMTNEGLSSQWVSSNVQIAGLLLPVPPDSVQVSFTTFTVTLWPVSAYPSAIYEFWRSLTPLLIGQIESNATQLATGTSLVDTGLSPDTTYYYYIRGTNQYGLSTWFAVQATTDDNIEEILDMMDGKILERHLGQYLTGEIEKISGIGPGSVNQRIEQAVAEISDALAYDPKLPYDEGDTVRGGPNGRRLYQAIVAVPAAQDGSNAPPNPLLWLDIGETVETANGLATAVSANTAKIEEVDGKVSSQAESINALRAQARPVRADGEKADALRGWQNQASYAQLVRTQATDTEASVTRDTQLTASVGDVNSRLTIEEQTRATADAALASRTITLEARMPAGSGTLGTEAAIQDEATARATADSALANRTATLEARMPGGSGQLATDAAVQNVQQALATATDALAQDITQVEASAGQAQQTADNAQSAAQQASDLAGGKGKVIFQSAQPGVADRLPQNLWIDTTGGANTPKRWDGSAWVPATDKVATDAAQAASNAQAAASQASAAVQVVAQAQASLEDGLSTMWAVKMQTDNQGRLVTAGIGLGIDGATQQSAFYVLADQFAVMSAINGEPTTIFTTSGTQTILREAVIGDATISFVKIKDDLQSANFQQGVSGWRIRKNGDFEINGSYAGEGRSTMTNRGLRVYDSNDVLRVKVGDLS